MEITVKFAFHQVLYFYSTFHSPVVQNMYYAKHTGGEPDRASWHSWGSKLDRLDSRRSILPTCCQSYFLSERNTYALLYLATALVKNHCVSYGQLFNIIACGFSCLAFVFYADSVTTKVSEHNIIGHIPCPTPLHMYACLVQLRTGCFLASYPVLFLDSPPERGEEKKSLVHIDCACAGFTANRSLGGK